MNTQQKSPDYRDDTPFSIKPAKIETADPPPVTPQPEGELIPPPPQDASGSSVARNWIIMIVGFVAIAAVAVMLA